MNIIWTMFSATLDFQCGFQEHMDCSLNMYSWKPHWKFNVALKRPKSRLTLVLRREGWVTTPNRFFLLQNALFAFYMNNSRTSFAVILIQIGGTSNLPQVYGNSSSRQVLMWLPLSLLCTVKRKVQNCSYNIISEDIYQEFMKKIFITSICEDACHIIGDSKLHIDTNK